MARYCLLPLLLTGCGDVLPNTPTATRAVTGTITVDGQPLTYGWVEWHPAGTTVGTVAGGTIDKQGHFECPAVHVGSYRVLVFVPGQPGLQHWSSPESALLAEVPAGGTERLRLNWDLASR